jgi:hypothetical protein
MQLVNRVAIIKMDNRFFIMFLRSGVSLYAVIKVWD